MEYMRFLIGVEKRMCYFLFTFLSTKKKNENTLKYCDGTRAVLHCAIDDFLKIRNMQQTQF